MRQNRYSINRVEDTKKRMHDVFGFLGIDPNSIPSNYTYKMDDNSFAITDYDRELEIAYENHLYQVHVAIREDEDTTRVVRLQVGHNLFELEESIYREYDTKHFLFNVGLEQNFELRVLHEENADQDLFIKSEFGKFSVGTNNRKDLANVACDDISFRGFSFQLEDLRDSFIRNHMDEIVTDLETLERIQPGIVRFLSNHSQKMREVQSTDVNFSRRGIDLLTEGYSNFIKSVMGLKTKDNKIKRMN